MHLASIHGAAIAGLAIASGACAPAQSSVDAASTSSPTTSSAAGGAAQGGASHGGAGGGATGRACKETTFGGDRPVTVHVPKGYACGTPAPLLFMLHGYSSTGAIEEAYFGFEKLADEKGFLYAHPEGTKDAATEQFWNATDACCDFQKSGVDDSSYLVALVDAIAAEYDVDPKRVYLFGHSNGAFMAYRAGCDHADRFAAVGGLAGAMFEDASKCKATEPVSVLAVHGTADVNISYYGGLLYGVAYPGAMTTVEDWAAIDGCDSNADTSSPNLDLEAMIVGAETTVTRFTGCKSGANVALWSMIGALHIPTLSADFTPLVVSWLLDQHKP
jgi:polyhydroxybutyrate depolymerase